MIHALFPLIFAVSGAAMIEFPRWPTGAGSRGGGGSRGARTGPVFHSQHIVSISNTADEHSSRGEAPGIGCVSSPPHNLLDVRS